MQKRILIIILFIFLFVGALFIGLRIFKGKSSDTGISDQSTFPDRNNTNNSLPSSEDTPETGNISTSDNQTIFNNTIQATPSSSVTVPRFTKITSTPSAGVHVGKHSRLFKTVPKFNITYDFIGFPTYRQGDTGENILKLQTILNYQDTSPSIPPTEIFDEKTRQAVVIFQESTGLKADGIVGKGTYASLNAFQGLGDDIVEDVLSVRYAEKEKGRIYEYFTEDGSSKIISDTLVPQIQEAIFTEDGSRVALRYATPNNTIKTFLQDLGEGGEKKNVGEFLPDNISSMSSYGSTLGVLEETGQGSIFSIIKNTTSNLTPLYTSNFQEWIIDWVSPYTVSFMTKASEQVDGFTYLYDIKKNTFSKLVGNKKGFTSKVGPGDYTLVGESKDKSFDFTVLNRKTGSLISTTLKTLPEKCVWHNEDIFYCSVPLSVEKADYPDAWYQGRVQFRDTLYRGVIEEDTILVSEFANISARFDGTMLSLDTEGEYLSFIDKTTGHVYGYNLAQ
ncbi:MAG: peptidoglycan hydrolase-like protein with peptidoglycan-binding domain [Flavobacteriaceae bacterium]|jgi:peptidoglycan hydrolase-like protein with peptidoglycan-binding domain